MAKCHNIVKPSYYGRSMNFSHLAMMHERTYSIADISQRGSLLYEHSYRELKADLRARAFRPIFVNLFRHSVSLLSYTSLFSFSLLGFVLGGGGGGVSWGPLY